MHVGRTHFEKLVAVRGRVRLLLSREPVGDSIPDPGIIT